MTAKKRPARRRVGRVSYYQHHGSWYLYYRDATGSHRPRVGNTEVAAEQAAALKNVELTNGSAAVAAPLGDDPLFGAIGDLDRRTFTTIAATLLGRLLAPSLGPNAALLQALPAPVTGVPAAATAPATTVARLRDAFLEHHEHVLASALPTVSRYSSASQHLANFAEREHVSSAVEISAGNFARYLRSIEVAPNGHEHSKRRPLSEKTISFTLQACGSMYRFGVEQKLLPKGYENPFAIRGMRKLSARRAKAIFVFDRATELKFFRAADSWTFAIHFVLAMTGLRSGELVHLLIEDVDFTNGWLRIRAKPELGWTVKTGTDRNVPLAPEVLHVIRAVIGNRTSGPIFRRAKITPFNPVKIDGDRAHLISIANKRLEKQRQKLGRKLTRREELSVLRGVWHDAGVVRSDRIRYALIQVAKGLGLSVTCPKSWRHTFATLLQEGNVDPLVRQITMGHQPARPDQSALGMTGVYTHTSPEIQHREILRALQLRREALDLGVAWAEQRKS